MTIAGFEILECPHCQKLYKKRLIGSFGTYGADFYSDGHVGGGFVPESLNIIKCLNKACGKFFRIQEAPVIAEFKNNDFNNLQWKDAHYLAGYRISAAGLEEALEQGFCQSESEEIQIRTMLLKRYNDWVRSDKRLDFPPDEKRKHLANIDKLLALAFEDISNVNRMLFRAELYREKGDFESCIQTLQKVKTDDENKIRQMQKLFSQAKVKVDRVANLAQIAIKKEYQCNQCGHGLILFDLSKMNSPYDYKYYYCRRENKVFSAPSKEYNRQSPEQFHCWQKSLGIKTPYERYIPKKNVYCTSCSNSNIIPFNPEVEKCIECNSGSYLHVKWFDE